MTDLTISEFSIQAKNTYFEAEIKVTVESYINEPAYLCGLPENCHDGDYECDYTINSIKVYAPEGELVEAGSLEKWIDDRDLTEAVDKAYQEYYC